MVQSEVRLGPHLVLLLLQSQQCTANQFAVRELSFLECSGTQGAQRDEWDITQHVISLQTSNMIYIVALGVGLKCPRKIHLSTQCPIRVLGL